MTASGIQSKRSAASAEAGARVPFVGCPSDGQDGPVAAPTGKDKYSRTSAETADRLAYYTSAQKLVGPQPLNGKDVLSAKWDGFAGPAIQLSLLSGETSGRFEVASVVARVFPTYKAFADDVIAEGIEPVSSFVFGPSPTDELNYKDKDKKTAEFQTPAQTEGLGTNSRLRKSDLPISGAILIGATGQPPDLAFLVIRLPPDLNDFAPIIIHRPERETARGRS